MSIEVGHCIDCCSKYDVRRLCNPNNPQIRHMKKEQCQFC